MNLIIKYFLFVFVGTLVFVSTMGATESAYEFNELEREYKQKTLQCYTMSPKEINMFLTEENGYKFTSIERHNIMMHLVKIFITRKIDALYNYYAGRANANFISKIVGVWGDNMFDVRTLHERLIHEDFKTCIFYMNVLTDEQLSELQEAIEMQQK